MKLSLLSLATSVFLLGCDLPEATARTEDKAAGPASPTSAATALPAEPASGTASPTTDAAPADKPITSTPPPPALPPNLPEAAREIVKLAHSQVGEGVLTNFIANLQEPFELDAEQIVYLRDLGISPEVIESLLVRQQQLAGAKASSPSPAPLATTAEISTEPAATEAAPTNAPTVYPGSKAELPPPQVGPAEAVYSGAPVNTEPQPVVNNYNYFYDSLAPYGNWITIPTYGYVWQPTCAVVSPSWRPYWNNGGWIWSDCGWYWNSYYSWGWAPFHYGNWCNAPGYGWCWAPGSTWGPSWVTFRYAPGYCGWAPLPPGCGWNSGVGLTWAGAGISVGFGFGYSWGNYCWTPTPYFANANCWKYGVTGKRVEQIYRDSTVINNYIVGDNNTVINNGINSGYVQRNSRGEVRKVQLADASSPSAASGLAAATARPSQSGRLPVYRPTVAASDAATGGPSSSRSEVRPTQFASRNRSAPDRFALPARPRADQSLNADSGSSVRPTIPVSSRNQLGNTVALHNGSRPNLGSPSAAASVPVRGSARPGVTQPSTSGAGGPVVIPSRGSSAANPRGSYTPNSPSAQRPSGTMPGRTEPRKPAAVNPGSAYQPAPGTQSPNVSAPGRINARPSGPNVRQNYSAPITPRSAPNYQSPSFSRPQSGPAPSRPSFNNNSRSFNSAPRSAPSGGGGGRSSGGGMSRPGPRGP